MEQMLEQNKEMEVAEAVEKKDMEEKKIKGFREDDRGVGVIEIVLILVEIFTI